MRNAGFDVITATVDVSCANPFTHSSRQPQRSATSPGSSTQPTSHPAKPPGHDPRSRPVRNRPRARRVRKHDRPARPLAEDDPAEAVERIGDVGEHLLRLAQVLLPEVDAEAHPDWCGAARAGDVLAALARVEVESARNRTHLTKSRDPRVAARTHACVRISFARAVSQVDNRLQPVGAQIREDPPVAALPVPVPGWYGGIDGSSPSKGSQKASKMVFSFSLAPLVGAGPIVLSPRPSPTMLHRLELGDADSTLRARPRRGRVAG